MKEAGCVLRPKMVSKQRWLSLIAFITIIKVCNKHITHLPSGSSWKTGVRWTWCQAPKTFKLPWVTRRALEDRCIRGRSNFWFPAHLQPGLVLPWLHLSHRAGQSWWGTGLMWHLILKVCTPGQWATFGLRKPTFPCTWTPQQCSCDPVLPLSWGTKNLGCSSFTARTFSVFITCHPPSFPATEEQLCKGLVTQISARWCVNMGLR